MINSGSGKTHFDESDTVREKFRVIANLKDGWDGYGGLAPSPQTIECAQTHVTLTAGIHGTIKLDILPTSDGGIMIDWARLGHSTSIEVTPTTEETQ